MIVIDTSVWVDHFRRGNRELVQLLEMGEALSHPFVIGELACGNLNRRDETLELMQQLPRSPAATDAEAMSLIEKHRLMGRGIGYVDVHLLASALLANGSGLWTLDAPLGSVAARLGVRFSPPS